MLAPMLMLMQTPAPIEAPGQFHFGGYGEIHFRQESGPGAETIDLSRFVFYLGYDFADWIELHSETEIEHGFVEGDRGEVSVEQLHVDFDFSPGCKLRIGRYLEPLGIVNLRHEPPSFLGVERPDVETFIIPSTWSGDGLGLFGECSEDWSYQLYFGSSLSGSGIDPIEGLHEARQEGQPGLDQPALSARVDWRPTSSLRTGVGAFAGGLDNGEEGINPGNDASLSVLSLDAQWSTGDFDFAGLYALDQIRGADTLATGVAERMQGWYLQGAWHCLPDSAKQGRLADADALLFARYEWLDTQASLPEGVSADPRGERTVLTLGASFLPVSNLVLKADYQIRDDQSAQGLPERFSLGLGWQF
ncbi:MAG: hypothetical protein IPJ19_20675 [Planctomycetes bacterium]|nr:hypothetical protein [Planctomycetota bacterium]